MFHREGLLVGGIVPRWFVSVAGPLLIVAALPLAAIVFGIAIGWIGATVVARAITAALARPVPSSFTRPVIDATYTIVEDRRTEV